MNIIVQYEMEMNGINSTHQHFDDIANLLSSLHANVVPIETRKKAP